jgi:hypothetical protein
MTAYSMDSAHDTPDSQDSDNPSHERQSQTAAFLQDETWSFASGAPADGAGSSSTTPHVSLFSPSVPPILPSAPPDVTTSSIWSHVGSYGAPKASRSMPSLSALANLPKRTPIVQLHTQIPPAQKSGDDPTTPLEDPTRKRTTMDSLNSQQSTMTSLSKLFSEPTISASRAPSYNNATGPLYLRGSLTLPLYAVEANKHSLQ